MWFLEDHSNLQIKNKIEKSKKNEKCESCGKSFTTLQVLERHLHAIEFMISHMCIHFSSINRNRPCSFLFVEAVPQMKCDATATVQHWILVSNKELNKQVPANQSIQTYICICK